MTNGDGFKHMFQVKKEESCYKDSMVAVSVDGFEICFPANWWKAELKEIKDIHIISIGDKPGGIKFADQIVKEMDARGQVIVPDNCVTGEAFEEWLYGEEPKEVEE